jgi:Arc/MetJ family transcription regulator
MRTNIDIDDRLMKRAIKTGVAKTKKGTVEEALRLMVRIRAQEAIGKLSGKVQWRGDLEADRSKDKWIEAEVRYQRDGVRRKTGPKPKRKAA